MLSINWKYKNTRGIRDSLIDSNRLESLIEEQTLPINLLI